MSHSSSTRQLARTIFQNTPYFSAPRPRCAAALQFAQPFSSSTPRHDDDSARNRIKEIMKPRESKPPPPITSPRPAGPPVSRVRQPMNELAANYVRGYNGNTGLSAAQLTMGRASKDTNLARLLDPSASMGGTKEPPVLEKKGPDPEPYHFHVFAHKHNTHVTVTKPSREPIVSLSCGNLGFRKSHRKTYDAAYQLGAYVVDKLQQQGWHNRIGMMEVCLRGFGQGREAVTKVLMGTEGSLLRSKVTKVSDSTRLKFGGTRSKAPRRL